MPIHRAEITTADKRIAAYESSFDMAGFCRSIDATELSNVLIIEVDDFDDAQELLATIERSRARKKKESPAPAAAAPDTSTAGAGKEDAQHKPLPPKCEVLNCPEAGKFKYECAAGDVGRFCEPHFTGATPTQLREWHEAYVALRGPNKLTPAPVARKNARTIREEIERKPEPGAEPGKVA